MEAVVNRDRYIEARVAHIKKKIDALITHPIVDEPRINMGGHEQFKKHIADILRNDGYFVSHHNQWLVFSTSFLASKKRDEYQKKCIEALENMIEDCINCETPYIRLCVQESVSVAIEKHFAEKGYIVEMDSCYELRVDIEINFPSSSL